MKFRTTMSKLSESLHRNLNTYTLAIGTAALSLLTTAPPSEGSIVYTPVNVIIGAGQQYMLDLNHDGVIDFNIDYVYHESNMCDTLPYVGVLPASGNGLMPSSDGYAAALIQGAVIGPSQKFYKGLGIPMVAVHRTPPCSLFVVGPWVNVVNHYLGLSFQVNGQTHYGWARLSVLTRGRRGLGFKVTLTGYAYETVASKSIIAGTTTGADSPLDEGDLGPDASVARPVLETVQSASLSMLAIGTEGRPSGVAKGSGSCEVNVNDERVGPRCSLAA